MLVLSRQRDERIVIITPEGREIEICVVDAQLGKCRIGVAADKSVVVHRKEVYDAIRREHRTSLQRQPHRKDQTTA